MPHTTTMIDLKSVLRDAPIVPSCAVKDIDSAYEEAQRLGFEIVYPLTTEPWGVRRFFLRAPDGNVINVVRHREPPNSMKESS